MPLAMKTRCERCEISLSPTEEAYICSFECTFCEECAWHFHRHCPNCGGELIARPRRTNLIAEEEKNDPGARTALRPLVVWASSFGIWIFIAFASGFSMYEFDRSLGRPMALRDELILPLINDFSFALLTPLIFLNGLRFPIWENKWGRWLLVFIGGAFVFVAAHVALRGSLYPVWDPRIRGYAYALRDPYTHAFAIQWILFKRLFFYNVVDDIVSIYLPVLLIGHVVAFWQRLRERELRTSQLETELANARLQALKGQLQPHFLFNTLHSISSLMLTDAGKADRMMTRLSDLLRMSLNDGGMQITTVKNEIEFVAAYLEIEKMRFEDRLKVVFDVSPDTLEAQIPHLLLQPLVENGLRHGISRTAGGGEIQIRIKTEERYLNVRVMDNGAGPAKEQGEQSGGGVGLQATRGRLKSLYGDEQTVETFIPRGGGFEVHIRLPLRIEPVNKNGTSQREHQY